MEMTRVQYISDKPSPYFKKGLQYEAFRAKDDHRGLFWCFHIENDDDPGDYGFPAHLFKIVPENEIEGDPARP